MDIAGQTKLLGTELKDLVGRLYPICRSITGDGLRDTLHVIQDIVPLTLHEVPTGTVAFDWTVPKEWNVRDAYVRNSKGDRVIDFQESNLHLLNYSVPVRERITLEELRPHLFSLPEKPEWIPYRTSYYKESWGFCLAHSRLVRLPEDTYDVVIDSSLTQGSLTYGEYFIPGETTDEVLISTHCCHPSLCNDNLSGIALSSRLALALQQRKNRLSYRFLFLPGTIGPIVWLSRNESAIERIKHGLVVACVGDPGAFTYKKSRRGNAIVDRAAEHVLRTSGRPYTIREFTPYGYDERQYCSPGFDLPVGSLTRTPHGEYPEYHTSADNLDLVRPEALAESFGMYESVLHVLDTNRVYTNMIPKCEPQLGKRGLYSTTGGRTHVADFELAMLWVLNLSDGRHALLDIAERSSLSYASVLQAAQELERAGVLSAC
jgi:aminopeptidase-like protein